MAEFFMLTLVAGLMIISPGPDFAIVVKNSLLHGRVVGLKTSLGIAAGNLVHVAVNLLGIGLLIAKSAFWFSCIKVMGASYLMFLGVKGLFAKRQLPMSRQESPTRQGFFSGFLTSVLNPKACLFYLSFFSVMLSQSTEHHTRVFYGIWISSLALLWFTSVTLFFASPLFSKKIESVKHWLERVTGGVLVILGANLIRSQWVTE